MFPFRILFWTDVGKNQAIKKANMDGSNVTTIVSTYLSFPKCLTLDEANSRIYWTDFVYDIIESSRFDGSDRQTITRSAGPLGIDIFGDFVFWSTTKANKIMVKLIKLFLISIFRVVLFFVVYIQYICIS